MYIVYMKCPFNLRCQLKIYISISQTCNFWNFYNCLKLHFFDTESTDMLERKEQNTRAIDIGRGNNANSMNWGGNIGDK